MYNPSVCEPHPDLFLPNPDPNLDRLRLEALATEMTNLKQDLPAILLRHGVADEHIPLLAYPDITLQQILTYGTMPATISINAPEAVSREPVAAELLSSQHEAIRSRFSTALSAFVNPFYCFTEGEAWWDGPPMFFVNTPTLLLMMHRYLLGRVKPEFLTLAQRKPGRPKKQDTEVVQQAAKERKETHEQELELKRQERAKQLQEAQERAAAYDQWTLACQKRKDHLKSLKVKREELRQDYIRLKRKFDAELLAARSQMEELRGEIKSIELEGAPPAPYANNDRCED